MWWAQADQKRPRMAIGSGALRFKATAINTAPPTFSPAKNRKLGSAPTSEATNAAVSRPIKLLATTPVTYAAILHLRG